MPALKIVPAILTHSLVSIQEKIGSIERYGDMLQIDVMDSIFVPNKTLGIEVIKAIKTKLPLDLHLMVQEPSQDFIHSLATANKKIKISSITVHYEACKDIKNTISFIKKENIKACVAINPKTPLSAIKNILKDISMVLIMTVEPGFGGQSFIPGPLEKVSELRKLNPKMDIEVDGGINEKTALLARKAGANVLVVNSYLWNSKDRKGAIERLRR